MAELSNWITEVSDWLTKAGLILVGSAATLVSVASIFGFLTEYPWIEERIALITLFLIGLLIMFVVFQQRDYLVRSITSLTQKGSTHRLHLKCILGS